MCKRIRILLLVLCFCFIFFIWNQVGSHILIADDKNEKANLYNACILECVKKEKARGKIVTKEDCKLVKEECISQKHLSLEVKSKRGWQFRLTDKLTADEIIWNKYALCMKRLCPDYAATIKIYK